MATVEVGNILSSRVVSRTLTGVVAGTPKAFYGVPKDTSFTATPTAAGTATCWISTSPKADCEADVAANNFATGLADWRSVPKLTAITSQTELVQPGPVTAFVIVAASGNWNLEAVIQ